MAEAKSEGYHPGAIRFVIKVRKEKPHDRQEREAMQDLYLHALGLDTEPPLFRFAGLAAIDTSARDQVIARMSEFVPPAGQGHIDVRLGNTTVRLKRAKDGSVSQEPVADLDPATPRTAPQRAANGVPREPVPDVDEAGAYALGREYARDNRAVIDNPFPYGDPRRARFDEGWRHEAGGDGMGPGEQ